MDYFKCRLIDRLVAEKVMGYIMVNEEHGIVNKQNGEPPTEFLPSTNLKYAWQVFQKFVKWNCSIEVAYVPEIKKYRCLIDTENATSNKKLRNVFLFAESAPLAICKAALKSVEA